jgi:REP-associated tyrosine transposase
MPRRSSAGRAGVVFHVMNRATQGQLLFRDHSEYLASHYLLARALVQRPIRLLGYCFMPNHVHMLVWPSRDDELTATMRWLFATHARQLHRWRGTNGRGAIYQSRFRAVPVQNEPYFYRVGRYIERNPVRGGLTDRAESWPWSSASPVSRMHGIELAEWPVPRPADWLEFVNAPEPAPDLDFIRACTANGKPIQTVEGPRFIPAIAASRNHGKNG